MNGDGNFEFRPFPFILFIRFDTLRQLVNRFNWVILHPFSENDWTIPFFISFFVHLKLTLYEPLSWYDITLRW